MAALKSSLRWVATPWGAAITLYALNIVAWGGMLFLLLVNAAPAMCRPSCAAVDSPRRVWIEIDAQILNALFCVTGFGLAPWRARDLFWWAVWRARAPTPCWCRLRVAARGGPCGRWARWWRGGSCRGRGSPGADGGALGGAGAGEGLRVLARIHRSWFRLPASPATEDDKPAARDADDAAAAGPGRPRAPPTPRWKLDFVVWTATLNTFVQVALATIMWGMDRFTRPSWATGLLVVLACVVGAASGGVIYAEQQRVKKVEGGGGEAAPSPVDAAGEEVKGAV
jgi:hypothetical protein